MKGEPIAEIPDESAGAEEKNLYIGTTGIQINTSFHGFIPFLLLLVLSPLFVIDHPTDPVVGQRI